MRRPPVNVDAQLEESLRRIGSALERNRDRYAAMVEQIVAGTSAEVAERIAASTERVSARTEKITAGIAERHRRRMDRWQRRHGPRRERGREREERGEPGDVPKGIVLSIAAIVLVILAVARPQFFWMVFVALGLGMSAASSFERALRRRRLAREAPAEGESENSSTAKPAGESAAESAPSAQPAAEPPDPKLARIQALCDKLLAELESGPAIFREVVTEPRATIGGLRQACLETARRERELRSVLAAQDEAGLLAERDALATRLSNEHDQIVRDRLGQALGALEQRLAHRAELATAAARLEAENTRILYTLENLHMQLLRARSTDIGAPELGGRLRDSLRELGTEIDAVAEALELASAPSWADAGKAAPGTSEPRTTSGTSATSAEKERAERDAAGRRAAQAREAQRH